MIYSTYKLHKAVSGVTPILPIEVAMCDAGTLRETLWHTNGVRISPSLSRTCPQQPGFKSGGLRYVGALQERVSYGRKFNTVDQLKQAIMLEWRALPRRFTD